MARFKIKDYRAEFNALRSAISRCTQTTNPQWDDYGGRGIIVDPIFMDPESGFDAFMNEVGPKPSPELTLDRVNNSLGYVPGNLDWATRAQQAVSRRPRKTNVKDLGWGIGKERVTTKLGRTQSATSALVEHDGRTQTLVAWAAELGLSAKTIRQRLQRGWETEQALTPQLYKGTTGFTPQ